MNDPPSEGHMASHIGRRKSAATWPLAARAQQGQRMRRIGVVIVLAEDDPESVARRAAFEHISLRAT